MTERYGYLSVRHGDEEVATAPVVDELGLYRDDGRPGTVHLVEPDDDTDLGVLDGSVSRRSTAGVPVRLFGASDVPCVENVHNETTLEVEYPGEAVAVAPGERERLRADCTIRVGYNTSLVVTRETGDTADSEPVSGVPPAAVANLLCEQFRHAETPRGASKVGQKLLDLLADEPPESERAAAARTELERRVSELTDLDGELGERRQQMNAETAARIEALYARSSE